MEITGSPERLNRAQTFIHRGIEAGQLHPIISKTFPFDQIVEAHRYLESNEQLGKIVVTVP
jgi:NADPH:quinone reductase-like Zn-dependent oxidoreductase